MYLCACAEGKGEMEMTVRVITLRALCERNIACYCVHIGTIRLCEQNRIFVL